MNLYICIYKDQLFLKTNKPTSFFLSKDTILPLCSAIGIFVSFIFFIPILGLICLVPLILSFYNEGKNLILPKAFIFSLVLSFFLFNWMLTSSPFTGSFIYGVLGMGFSVVLFTGLFTFIFFIWSRYEKNNLTWPSILLLAGLFTFLEFLCDNIFKTFPWYCFHFGNPLIGSVYTIQWAELGGIYILTFFTILINGGIAYYLKDRNQKKWIVIIIIAFAAGNGLLYQSHSNSYSSKEKVTINLLNANINPSTNWKLYGNDIVNTILSLNKQSLQSPADFNIWTESIVPWTFKNDDDFVNEILHELGTSKTTTVLGMTTDLGEKLVLNSAYAIKSDRSILGRYDKVDPLTFMESSLHPRFPFVFLNNGSEVKAGKESNVIATEKAVLGIYLCNEATISQSARDLTKKGADLLVNMSDDGWFKYTYQNKIHFYFNALRAVENRRDIAINSNCGYSGKVQANGKVIIIDNNKTPFLNHISLDKRTELTFYTKYPNVFIIIILLTTLLILIKRK